MSVSPFQWLSSSFSEWPAFHPEFLCPRGKRGGNYAWNRGHVWHGNHGWHRCLQWCRGGHSLTSCQCNQRLAEPNSICDWSWARGCPKSRQRYPWRQVQLWAECRAYSLKVFSLSFTEDEKVMLVRASLKVKGEKTKCHIIVFFVSKYDIAWILVFWFEGVKWKFYS